MLHHRIALALVPVALALGLHSFLARAAETLDLLAQARVNNATASVTFRLDPRRARVSEIRIRAGSLAVHLEAVEILFADGGHARIAIGDSLPPGRQSRPIAVDSKRAVSQVLVFKRPGLRPGETALQLVGVAVK